MRDVHFPRRMIDFRISTLLPLKRYSAIVSSNYGDTAVKIRSCEKVRRI